MLAGRGPLGLLVGLPLSPRVALRLRPSLFVGWGVLSVDGWKQPELTLAGSSGHQGFLCLAGWLPSRSHPTRTAVT